MAVHPMIFYRILDAIPVAGWQVVQERDRLCLQLSGPMDGADEQTLVATVRLALMRQGVRMPPITVEWRQEIAARRHRQGFANCPHLSGQPVQPALRVVSDSGVVMGQTTQQGAIPGSRSYIGSIPI